MKRRRFILGAAAAGVAGVGAITAVGGVGFGDDNLSASATESEAAVSFETATVRMRRAERGR